MDPQFAVEHRNNYRIARRIQLGLLGRNYDAMYFVVSAHALLLTLLGQSLGLRFHLIDTTHVHEGRFG